MIDNQSTGVPPPARRNGWLTALMIAGGIVLLLPGLCAGFFMTLFLHDWRPGQGPIDPGFLALWALCFGIATGGGVLIWVALRRPR